MAKTQPSRSTAYSDERFAHPFFVSDPPAARAPQNGHKRMLDFNRANLGRVPPPARNQGKLSLADVIGATGATEIQTAGELRFHALGDSGVNHATEAEAVAEQMARAFDPNAGGKNPAFLFHLGDVVYGNLKDDHYGERFYRPYMHYPGKIVAIPGNHDGEVKVDADKPSLKAFLANFCAPAAVVPPQAASSAIFRKTMTQPGVYWMMDAPFARIIALYSNIAEGPGFLEGKTDQGQPDASQIDWLTARLKEIAAADRISPKALILAMHHPPFSQGSHNGSGDMLQQIKTCCAAAGVWPHAILSGHAHNYQRYTWKISVDNKPAEVPCIVAGTGGIGTQRVVPATGQKVDEAVYVKALQSYGFLTVAINAKKLTIAFWPSNGAANKAYETISVDLKKRKVV